MYCHTDFRRCPASLETSQFTEAFWRDSRLPLSSAATTGNRLTRHKTLQGTCFLFLQYIRKYRLSEGNLIPKNDRAAAPQQNCKGWCTADAGRVLHTGCCRIFCRTCLVLDHFPYLAAAIDVGVEDTQDVLELGRDNERLPIPPPCPRNTHSPQDTQDGGERAQEHTREPGGQRRAIGGRGGPIESQNKKHNTICTTQVDEMQACQQEGWKRVAFHKRDGVQVRGQPVSACARPG